MATINRKTNYEKFLEIHHNPQMAMDYLVSCNTRRVIPTTEGYWTYCTQNGIDLIKDENN